MRGAVRWAGRLAVVALAAVAAFLAGRTTVGGPTPGSGASPTEVLATARTATLGRTLSFNAVADTPQRLAAVNHLAGVVTWVAGDGVVNTGAAVFEVARVPVRVVVGQVPFYRDLRPGDRGEDVRQLNAALAATGRPAGAGDEWTADTSDGLARWQQTLGIPTQDLVRLGELVAVPRLPARVVLDEHIVAGVGLTGGEPAVKVPAGAPDFVVTVGREQAANLPSSASVTLRAPGGRQWLAVLGQGQPDSQGMVQYHLRTAAGGAPCGDECDTVPAGTATSFPAAVQLAPPTTGTAVPASAVRTDPDHTAWVTVVAGAARERRDVGVVASQDGLVVVTGISVGDVVLL